MRVKVDHRIALAIKSHEPGSVTFETTAAWGRHSSAASDDKRLRRADVGHRHEDLSLNARAAAPLLVGKLR
jgi:hypothetical protein